MNTNCPNNFDYCQGQNPLDCPNYWTCRRIFSMSTEPWFLPYCYDFKIKAMVVIENKESLGFLIASRLPYRRSKNRLTVTRNFKEHGFWTAKPINYSPANKGFYSYDDVVPSYLKTRRELRELKLPKPAKPDAIQDNCNRGNIHLYDIRKIEPKKT